MYLPSPYPTQHVKLPKDLSDLTEKLAQNTHEVWAQKRIAEGWVYGPERNDKAKTHPCLIPYDQLPENEKDYDRNSAMETIKLITALGYKIEFLQGV